MRSCFRFDRNTKRVTWLFYYASICLFEQNNTTNHTASIAPASPQDGVITYTTVCSSRQAASNPIGLNLHLDFARLSYILFPLKTYLAILQVLDCASHIYLHIQLYRILPGIRPNTSLTPNVPWSLQEPSSRCHSAGRHCRQALTEAKKVPKFTSRDSFQLKQL